MSSIKLKFNLSNISRSIKIQLVQIFIVRKTQNSVKKYLNFSQYFCTISSLIMCKMILSVRDKDNMLQKVFCLLTSQIMYHIQKYNTYNIGINF